ncbi:hypothetical protein D9M68_700730 [compost metagenome]
MTKPRSIAPVQHTGTKVIIITGPGDNDLFQHRLKVFPPVENHPFPNTVILSVGYFYQQPVAGCPETPQEAKRLFGTIALHQWRYGRPGHYFQAVVFHHPVTVFFRIGRVNAQGHKFCGGAVTNSKSLVIP